MFLLWNCLLLHSVVRVSVEFAFLLTSSPNLTLFCIFLTLMFHFIRLKCNVPDLRVKHWKRSAMSLGSTCSIAEQENSCICALKTNCMKRLMSPVVWGYQSLSTWGSHTMEVITFQGQFGFILPSWAPSNRELMAGLWASSQGERFSFFLNSLFTTWFTRLYNKMYRHKKIIMHHYK